MALKIQLDRLAPGSPWVVCEAIGEWESTGAHFRTQHVDIGARGYLKRNANDPNYIQVLMPDTRGSICGFYLRLDKAITLLWPAKLVAKSHVANIDTLWSGYWRGMTHTVNAKIKI